MLSSEATHAAVPLNMKDHRENIEEATRGLASAMLDELDALKDLRIARENKTKAIAALRDLGITVDTWRHDDNLRETYPC